MRVKAAASRVGIREPPACNIAACLSILRRRSVRSPACGCSSSATSSPGPFAGQLLGDYGADVIKIEAPDGDPMREWGITHQGNGLWWPAIARNKRSVVADLRADAGRDLVRSDRATVWTSSSRTSVRDAWSISVSTTTTVARLNPGVIVVHVSGFGQTGPRSQEAGFGSIGEAVGGIRHTTGDPDRPPARCGVSLGDSLAALFAVIGTLAALREREQSGRGQEVDVAIYEAVAAVMESTMADFEIGGVVRGRSRGLAARRRAVGRLSRPPTGSDVIIAGNADSVFARLCDAMGRADLAATLGSRPMPPGAERRRAGRADLGVDRAPSDAEPLLDGLLAEHAVPAGRVYAAPDMVSDPHFLAREMVLRATSRAGYRAPHDRHRAPVLPNARRRPRRRARSR